MNPAIEPWQPGAAGATSPDRRARLRATLPLIERAAGAPQTPAEPSAEAQAHAAAYAAAPPIARRRFDAIAAEAAAATAAGIQALVRCRDATGRDCGPAAETLAATVRSALTELDRLAPAS